MARTRSAPKSKPKRRPIPLWVILKYALQTQRDVQLRPSIQCIRKDDELSRGSAAIALAVGQWRFPTLSAHVGARASRTWIGNAGEIERGRTSPEFNAADRGSGAHQQAS